MTAKKTKKANAKKTKADREWELCELGRKQAFAEFELVFCEMQNGKPDGAELVRGFDAGQLQYRGGQPVTFDGSQSLAFMAGWRVGAALAMADRFGADGP